MTGELNQASGGRGPHAGMPMIVGGPPLAAFAGAMVVLHGRGGRADDLMGVAAQVAGPDVTLFGPEAFHGTWYPHRFLEPVEANEPYLGSAVSVVDDLLERLSDQGIPADRIALLGFSQGACLALEAAARSRVQLGAVVAFSGGLIGAAVDFTRYRAHPAMRVILSCAERDPHIPVHRVRETATALGRLGATVVTRLHPGSRHSIEEADIREAAGLACIRSVPILRHAS